MIAKIVSASLKLCISGLICQCLVIKKLHFTSRGFLVHVDQLASEDPKASG